MPTRILTRFAGPLLTAEHDTDTDTVADLSGDHRSCTLAEFLRAASRERRMHRELGWPYRITQEIEDDGDAS